MTYELEIKPLQGNVTIEELLAVAQQMLGESRFARLGMDRDKLFFHCSTILTSEQSLAFGAFARGVLCGMAIGVCGEVLPFSSSVVATEHYLYLQPQYRGSKEAGRLINSFLREALRRGAEDVVFSNGFGGDPAKVGKLFLACGMTYTGGIYTLGA